MLILSVVFVYNVLFACTSFSFKDKNGHIVFGKNFDFPVGTGHIEINKKNMQKIAFQNVPQKPLIWVSKYGSITFNQIGREFPYGGMNETGLVIEQMWLEETQYPLPDSRYEITELQWIQYQLDNSATIQDVIASDTLIRISNTSVAKIHFLIADAEGNVAVIEFIKGEMLVYMKDQLPFSVLTNCPYEISLKFKESIDKKEIEEFSEWTKNSSGRFVKVVSLIDNYSKQKNIIDYSFLILDNVAQAGSTQWSIVYDLNMKEIYFKTKDNTLRQKLELQNFNFSCNSPEIFVPVSDTIRSIKSFQESNYKSNYLLQKNVVSKIEFLKNTITNEQVVAMAKYPETIFCIDDNDGH